MGNNLAVKVTADVTDLTAQMAVARAEYNATTAALREAVKASIASGQANIAASQNVQQAAENVARARTAYTTVSESAREAGVSISGFASRARAETEGVGGAFESMAGKVNTALKFTGVGVAIEGVRKLMEVFGEASERANQIRSMSEVLGVTTTQFQAMQVAAEEAGIGSEVMFRGTEKLVTVLNEARDGSGAAIEKLKALGITNEQIGDKSFAAAQMIAFLSQRLNDSSTSAQTMAAITKDLGARAALVAEGIKQLGGNTDEWNKKAAEANALSDAQLSRLHEIGAWWGIVGRSIKNAGAQLAIWSADAVQTVVKTQQAMAEAEAGLTSIGGATAGGWGGTEKSDAQVQAQQQLAAEVQKGNAAITKDTLDSIRDQIEGTKQGRDRKSVV